MNAAAWWRHRCLSANLAAESLREPRGVVACMHGSPLSWIQVLVDCFAEVGR